MTQDNRVRLWIGAISLAAELVCLANILLSAFNVG